MAMIEKRIIILKDTLSYKVKGSISFMTAANGLSMSLKLNSRMDSEGSVIVLIEGEGYPLTIIDIGKTIQTDYVYKGEEKLNLNSNFTVVVGIKSKKDLLCYAHGFNGRQGVAFDSMIARASKRFIGNKIVEEEQGYFTAENKNPPNENVKSKAEEIEFFYDTNTLKPSQNAEPPLANNQKNSSVTDDAIKKIEVDFNQSSFKSDENLSINKCDFDIANDAYQDKEKEDLLMRNSLETDAESIWPKESDCQGELSEKILPQDIFYKEQEIDVSPNFFIKEEDYELFKLQDPFLAEDTTLADIDIIAETNYFNIDDNNEKNIFVDAAKYSADSYIIEQAYRKQFEADVEKTFGYQNAAHNNFDFKNYSKINIKTDKGGNMSYYDNVKDKVLKLIYENEKEQPLNDLIPESEFVRVYYGKSKFYCVGIVKDKGEPVYICYGVPAHYSSEPPEEFEGLSKWIPLDAKQPKGKGYFMMFQSVHDGKCISMD